MEEKSSEVTFKYYLPEHEDDLWVHVNAQKMASLLRKIDQEMRSIIKYEDIPADHPRKVLAEEIRKMIHEEINLYDLT